ncbi:MAG: hypothetical protein RIT45_2700 [Pseudomonadota bacterium]|jgi:hypothetical protein
MRQRAVDEGVPTRADLRPWFGAVLSRRALRLGLGGALALALPAFAAAATARPAAPAADWRARVTERLVRLYEAERRGDADLYARIVRNGEATFDAGGRLLVQLDLAAGVPPAAIRDDELARVGARASTRAVTVMDVDVALADLPALVRALGDRLQVARLPYRPTPLAGPTTSQGAAQVAPPASLACTGNDGSGVTVVVLDAGFEKWDAGVASGELPKTLGTVANVGGTHGTMCGEVIADVAPGATLMPVNGSTFAVVQKLVAQIVDGTIDARVVSHSVIWFGMSFGRHEGPVCALTDKARQAGVAWVNAAGNSGGGNFWTGVWTDTDKDGHQDFGPASASGDKNLLRFRQYGGQIKLALDWDDYTLRETNLDLHLYRETDKGLEFVSSSVQQNGVFVAPFEQVVVNSAKSGIYVAVVTGKKTRPGLRLRLVNLGGGSQSFSVWHGAGNVYDPASCDGVLTVGAVPTGQWAKGTLASYSSHGPLVDGRNKPEVVAPTSVATSVGNFGGTSAACPHAAGAVALALAMTEDSAPEVAARIIAGADPIALAVPHPMSGYGRVQLDAELGGSQCEAEAQGASCTTSCGSAGTRDCSATCRWLACVPPTETCNGVDDDCDGDTDEGCPVSPDAGVTDDAAGVDAEDIGTADGGVDGEAGDLGSVPTPRATDDGCSIRPGGDGQGGRHGLAWAALVLLSALTLRRRYRTKT